MSLSDTLSPCRNSKKVKKINYTSYFESMFCLATLNAAGINIILQKLYYSF